MRLRQAVLAAILAVPPHGLAPRLPGVAPDDPRHVVDVAQAPWRALGRVQTELGTRCTGVAIGPATVLTAAHCLVSRSSRHLVQPGSVHFLLGYAAGRFAGHAVVRRYLVPPAFDPASGEPAGADWAVLILTAPLAAPGVPLRLDTGPLPPGATVALAGYEQDRDELLVADPSCRILGTTRDAVGLALLRDTCSATHGASGGPLLVQAPDGGWSVAGILVRGLLGGAGGYAVPAAAIAAGD
jgi:protease YdgD